MLRQVIVRCPLCLSVFQTALLAVPDFHDNRTANAIYRIVS